MSCFPEQRERNKVFAETKYRAKEYAIQHQTTVYVFEKDGKVEYAPEDTARAAGIQPLDILTMHKPHE